MAQGAQSKALIIANKTQFGFDATKIYEADGKTIWADVANFDKAPELFSNQKGTGTLPQGVPPTSQGFSDATGPELGQGISFAHPDVSRENADRRTTNADPTPDMPGA